MEKEIVLNTREQDVCRICTKVDRSEVSRQEAAKFLGISLRTLDRKRKSLRLLGPAGAVHGNRGRTPSNLIPSSLLSRAMTHLSDPAWKGIGPVHASELLQQRGVSISRESVRLLMASEGLRPLGRGRGGAAHPPRPRRERLGELVQIDGSPHEWIEGLRFCLVQMVDDATGAVLAARFEQNECSRGYAWCMRSMVREHGIPQAVYSDRHSIFAKSNGGEGPTRFGAVLERLGTELILARSPQAKGRVERANRTHQARLVAEMRLAGVRSVKEANDFLPGYLARHNTRFAVPAALAGSAMVAWVGESDDLDLVCSLREPRRLDKNGGFSAKGFRLQAAEARRFSGRAAELVEDPDGNEMVLVDLRPIRFSKSAETPSTEPLDRKGLDQEMSKPSKSAESAARRMAAALKRAGESKARKAEWKSFNDRREGVEQ